MPHKTHCCSETENEIYHNEEYGSLEILMLFVFIKIICVDSKERHGKTTSTNGRIFWKKIEKNSNRNSRPNPQPPCPFFPMGIFDDSANKEEKYDIAE